MTTERPPSELKPLIYAQLQHELSTQLVGNPMPPGPVPPCVRNVRTSLGAWLRHLGKTLADEIGNEFHRNVEDRITEFVDGELARGISPATVRDRKYFIGRVHALYLRMRSAHLPRSFSGALDALIVAAGLNNVEVEARTQIPMSVISVWRREKSSPGFKSPLVPALEQALGVEPGTLTSRLPRVLHKQQPASAVQSAPTTPYREHMVQRAKQAPYALMYVSDALMAEWAQVLRYKTTPLPTLKRHRRAVWRAKPPELCRVLLPDWCWTLADGRKVPTGHINWNYLRHYLGWLSLPEASGGRGICVEAVQSVAWLTRSDLLEEYLHWTAERAGNYNAFTRGILDVTVSLLNPTTGFFPQQPQLLDRLPENWRPATSWEAHCAEAYARLCAFRKNVTPSIVPTRDPEASIRELLGEKNPLSAIFDMLRAMEEAMPSATAPERRAIHLRDMVLVALLLGNPLRITQYITMQYGPGTREHLYRTKDGTWRIRQEPDTFKNGRTTARKPYNVRVADITWPYIERYLAESRPLLLGGQKSRYLLVGQHAGVDAPVSNLDDRLQVLTARYIPGSPGFRAQAWRHLAGTAWMRSHPRDYVNCALLLNDSLPVVVRRYSHLETADGLDTYGEWLSSTIRDRKKTPR